MTGFKWQVELTPDQKKRLQAVVGLYQTQVCGWSDVESVVLGLMKEAAQAGEACAQANAMLPPAPGDGDDPDWEVFLNIPLPAPVDAVAETVKALKVGIGGRYQVLLRGGKNGGFDLVRPRKRPR